MNRERDRPGVKLKKQEEVHCFLADSTAVWTILIPGLLARPNQLLEVPIEDRGLVSIGLLAQKNCADTQV